MPYAWDWQLSHANYSVRIESDGQVAYAYLIKSGKIVGDVWLCNIDLTPTTKPWNEQTREMPFRNPQEFSTSHDPISELDPNDITVFSWIDHDAVYVGLLRRGHPMAILGEGTKPGWSRNASRAGPLAVPLNIEFCRSSTNNQENSN